MKKLIALLLALCMVASLAACGPNDDKPTETSKPADDSKPEASESSAAEDIKLREGEIEIMHSTGVWLDIINEAKPVLAERMPNVKFTFTELGTAGAETLAAVGELPDIGFGPVSTSMLESEVVVDFYDKMKPWVEENFKNPAAWYTTKNQMVCLGSGTDNYYTGVYYYNKDIFAKEGLKVPTTYKEYEDLIMALIDKGYAIPLSHSNWSFSAFQMEQTIIAHSPEAYDDLMHNKTDFNDPRIREAVTAFGRLVDAKAFGKGLAEKDITASIAEFVQGDCPMMSTYSWNSASVAGKTAFEVGQFYMPSNDPKYPSGTVYPCWGSNHNGWWVGSQTKDLDLTLEALKILVEVESQHHFNDGKRTNFKIEGEPKFPDQLAADYDAMYQKIETFMPSMTISSFDAALNEEYNTLMTEWMLDDTKLTAEEYCDRLQALWEENTYFDFY